MPEPARWRCFVAVPLGDELRASLGACVERWRSDAVTASLRWTDPDGWHLTLAFLGMTDPGQVPAIVEALSAAASTASSATFDTGGLGAFPSRGRARVLWYGVRDEDHALRRLAVALRDRLGMPPDDRFRAHVTLARCRTDPVDLRPFLETAVAPDGVLDMTAIQLMRSHLGRGPARYESLASVPVGGSPA
jgi:2'-5' RNA ligase